ncbi:phosphoribosylanthranilate isomerase [Larsenimonas suaedae]|uniref:N-(5'-phosphoribosyl)anthranilate isomerase n=1 Tax=Larsenimonas suaedae TaxID=1851019 RepID=A0ABU1GYP6_9GAMM|nr:phosphoribosylanthranilate isomerase [Larsenimonas suaedae]MCM2971435.1 phosphoribosylanthranilate isomerase [Larsenimonas suaedae]MDR5896691.1 phosphoribosylanthranilate isomerase [Larsenimonas suaedae]
MNRCRVKICGLTRPEDVRLAVEYGADALGFVLWPGSARAITPEQLVRLSAEVPPFVTRVGLFVDQPADVIAQCMPYLDLLQFHGSEPPEACEVYGKAWIKAIRMKPELDLEGEIARYQRAQGILLDAYRPGVPGGTGETFEWSRVPSAPSRPIILAGGLTPDNVGEAISRTSVYAVDVSGGVEQGKGIKSSEAMRAFIEQVGLAAQYKDD